MRNPSRFIAYKGIAYKGIAYKGTASRPCRISIKPRQALLSAACIGITGASHPASAAEAVIRVDSRPRQAMTYGMDFERLWHVNESGVQINFDELAQWSVGKCRVDYVRIAINPAAELEEGKINWRVYDKQLELMRAIAKVRPDIKWFASPRPLHNEMKGAPFTPFPLWVNVWQPPQKDARKPKWKFLRLEAEKGADYYARYLAFMKEQGFKITYLDALNEASVHLQVTDIARMMNALRKKMGDQMPLVIAPSAHNRGEGTRWIKEGIEKKCADFWDITGIHNTGAGGTFEEFVKAAQSLKRPIWNTELHGFDGPDDKAVANSAVLFRHIRAGFNGIDGWLTLGNEKKEHKMLRNIKGKLEVMRAYYIFAQLVNSSGGGHYLDSNVPELLTSTMAFRNEKDGSVTVWVLNNSDKSVDTLIEIEGMTVQPVEVRWWSPDNDRDGSLIAEGLKGNSSLAQKVAAHSLYCFTFRQTKQAKTSQRPVP